MLNPYFLTALLYASVAALIALDASLTSFGLTPFLSGLRWLRVHFITLGIMAQMIFGFLNMWMAARSGARRPKTRWGIWLIFNIGLIALLIGIPLVNTGLIFVGGSLIFIAASTVIASLLSRRPQDTAMSKRMAAGRRFYLAGLGFLLIGIFLGTGLWLGWGVYISVKSPLEAHIHANNWGFMGLVFAGLIVDFYSSFTGRPLAWPRSISAIFWLLTIGAALLVIGPWLGNNAFVLPGIVIYMAGTGMLLANMIRPVWGGRDAKSPGLWHLLTAYVWITLPVLVAPLLILGALGIPAQTVEASAPQALIYGWVLQVGVAFIPFLMRRAVSPDQPAALGGSWLSLSVITAGCVLLWLGIFLQGAEAQLHALAYAFWCIALILFVCDLLRITPTPELIFTAGEVSRSDAQAQE